MELDGENASFWNELCGTEFARNVGVRSNSADDLRRFDDAYFAFYPYLAKYVTDESLNGKRVLEIGLGYGTLGEFIARSGCSYFGVDISPGPVGMMRHRLSRARPDGGWLAQRASALALPFADASLDYVYSIGCLHHTGDLPKAISETHRVLKPGGKAVLMLYARYSATRFIMMSAFGLRRMLGRSNTTVGDAIRGHYDSDTSGAAAPHTDFASKRAVKKMFSSFARVRIDKQNWQRYSFRRLPRLALKREWFLNNLARVAGTDHYIVATK